MVSLSSPQHFQQIDRSRSIEQFPDPFEEENECLGNTSRIYSYGLAYFYQLGNPGFKGELSDSPICVVSPSPVENVKKRNKPSDSIRFHWQSRIFNFYNKYNKSKLKEADELLEQYKGNEIELFQALEEKYGPEFQFISAEDSQNGDLLFTDHFVGIACSAHGSFALNLSGDVYHWGYLYEDICMKPLLIWNHIKTTKKACVIDCGRKHAALITECGELYTWGCGIDGQLGHGARDSRREPTRVDALTDNSVQFVGCGGGHTVVADGTGSLYAFGNNRNGQLGFAPSRESKITVTKPKLVKTQPIKSTFCLNIACGRQHTAVMSNQGYILTFGGGRYGRLGHGPSALREANYDQGIPKSVVYKPRVLKHGSLGRPIIGYQVACGDFHTIILDTNGIVYSCGKNDDGQCGHGTPHNYVSPRVVESLNGFEISMVAAGGNVSMALLADGSVYTWGNSECGSLGFTIDHGIAPHMPGKDIVKTSSGVDPVLDGKNAVSLPCLMENVPSIAMNVACSGSHTLVVAENDTSSPVGLPRKDEGQASQYDNDSFSSSIYAYTYENGHTSASQTKERGNNSEICNNNTKKESNDSEVSNQQQIFDVKYIFSRVRHGHYDDISSALQKGFSADTRDNQGNTILLVASQNGYKRIAKLCLRYGADINAQNSISGNTALHFSFLYNHLGLFDYLLGKGANDNILNKMEETCYDLEAL